VANDRASLGRKAGALCYFETSACLRCLLRIRASDIWPPLRTV